MFFSASPAARALVVIPTLLSLAMLDDFRRHSIDNERVVLPFVGLFLRGGGTLVDLTGDVVSGVFDGVHVDRLLFAVCCRLANIDVDV